MKAEIQGIQEEVAKKQEMAAGLDAESASLEKTIDETRRQEAASGETLMIQAKDKEIEELRDQLAKIKAEQAEMLERNRGHIKAL